MMKKVEPPGAATHRDLNLACRDRN